ncbi:hypothetical protein FACS1894176_05270 [Bacteroidia bacterium]|nr:hypothetical protein FACS1894176_05270 [Bacteroidia bacterium]
MNIENDTLTLPDKELKLGSLQNLYSSFYTTLFEYKEYQRLLYYPQKIEMTKERIAQYEEQTSSTKAERRTIYSCSKAVSAGFVVVFHGRDFAGRIGKVEIAQKVNIRIENFPGRINHNLQKRIAVPTQYTRASEYYHRRYFVIRKICFAG